MPSAAEEFCEPSGKCQGISHCLESGPLRVVILRVVTLRVVTLRVVILRVVTLRVVTLRKVNEFERKFKPLCLRKC